jgi:hypothetical protein
MMRRFRPSDYSAADAAAGAAADAGGGAMDFGPWLSAAKGLFALGGGAFDYYKTKKIVGQQLAAGQQQYTATMEQIKAGREQAALNLIQFQKDSENQRKTISLVVPAFLIIAVIGVAAKVYLSTTAKEEAEE